MNLKDMKIFIPEIPKEWKNRMRSGHTNIWNDSFDKNGLTEVKLDPPQKGLYAERFDDGWYWVCDCPNCLGIEANYPYIVCDEHNRCITCNTHRSELKETPWGNRKGFQCKPCADREHRERKHRALADAQIKGHSEDDCWNTDKLICPKCASECSSEEMGAGEHDVTCGVCDTDFSVEVEYETRFTSSLKKVTA